MTPNRSTRKSATSHESCGSRFPTGVVDSFWGFHRTPCQPGSNSETAPEKRRIRCPIPPPMLVREINHLRHFSENYRVLSRVNPTWPVEWPRGVAPRGPHGTVLEPLGSHGSCHSKRADALSATTEQFLLLPVDHAIVALMACPLCSTGITPLHHYYETVRP